MHTAYIDHSAGYPQIVTHFEPDDEADQAFNVHSVALDLDRLTPAELQMVIGELSPETIKRMHAAIVDHRP